MKRYFFYRAEIMVPNEGDPASFRQATQHACFANYSFGFRMTHQRVVNILMNELLHKNNYHLIKLDYFFKLSKEDHDKIVKACHEPLVVE